MDAIYTYVYVFVQRTAVPDDGDIDAIRSVDSEVTRLIPEEDITAFTIMFVMQDRLCGLVVKVPGYRYRGSGLIPGATRFFLRSGVSGTGSGVIIEELFQGDSGSGLENRN
jgi:hypothetical protein